MDDTATDAARLVELAHLPWDQQSHKVKSELSKLRTGRSDEYARALIAAHERIRELETRMAEGFAARAGQIENGAKMIAKLRAENAKLRRVVEADFKLFHAKEYGTLNEHQQALRMRADALSALEPPNVPDATDNA